MTSITPLLDMRLENPMVTGYGFITKQVNLDPIEISYCPCCHSKWVKMPAELADDPERPWETKVGLVWHTSPEHPVGRTYCRSCASTVATINDMIRFIEERKLQQQAIEYAIIASNDWERKLDPEWVPWLWDAMKIKLYTECRMRDFLQDEHADEFTDWMMERSRK